MNCAGLLRELFHTLSNAMICIVEYHLGISAVSMIRGQLVIVNCTVLMRVVSLANTIWYHDKPAQKSLLGSRETIIHVFHHACPT